jgi:hypothetical protein
MRERKRSSEVDRDAKRIENRRERGRDGSQLK